MNKIEQIRDITNNTILVTMDVKSLFRQIPHSEGISAVARALEKMKESKMSNRVIIKFLSLTLCQNSLEFNGKHYLQTKGSSMGSKNSCRYADIFMDAFEVKHIYQRIYGKHLAYYRFVDEIFIVWNGELDELLRFFDDINKIHDNIKFDCKYSKESINFLDSTVFKNQRGSLSIKLFTKPTDRPGYIQSKSYHPKSQIRNIPYGQALRSKRINTEDLRQTLDNIKMNFTKRGYTIKEVEEQFSRMKDISRENFPKYKEKGNDSRLKFTIIYNRKLPEIREIIDKNWNILSTNEKQAKIFKDKPILTFKRNKNLKDMLGGSRLMNNRKIVKKQPKRDNVVHG